MNTTLNNTLLIDEDGGFPDKLFSPELAYTSILVFIGSSLCAGAGVGGGSIYLPLYLVVLGLNAKSAPALSQATIFGVALGSFMINVWRRHPNQKRPLINYNLVLLLEPMILAGTVIGVFLNTSFPNIVTIVTLLLVLLFACYKTFRKAFRVRKEEHKIAKAAKKVAEKEKELEENYTKDSPDAISSAGIGSIVTIDIEQPSTKNEDLIKCLKNEARLFPWEKYIVLGVMVLGLFVLRTLAGGKSESAIGIKCNSPLFWTLLLGLFVYLSCVSAGVGVWLNKNYAAKKKMNFPFVKGDIKWAYKKVIILALLATTGGIVAGFVGIGGGMIQAPLMLELGILPQVVSATSVFMVLFTSSATILQFVILGKLPLDFGAWYMCVGMCGAIIGHLTLGHFVKKYKKQSIVVFLLGAIIILGVCGLIYVTTQKAIDKEINFKFSSVCD